MYLNTWKRIIVFILLLPVFLSACRVDGDVSPTAAEPTSIFDQTEPQSQAEPLEPTSEQPIVRDDAYSNTNPDGQVVTFWHPYAGERETALLEIVQEFNRTNAWNITVIAAYQGSQEDLFNKMLTFMNTAEVPNLIVADPHQSTTYHLGGALIDLNELVYSEKWGLASDEINDFFPGFFDRDVFSNFGDIRLGFPIQGAIEVLYYNLDWLRELGKDAPLSTPEEFKEVACAAANQPFSGATAEGSIGYSLNMDATRFAAWTFAFGGQIFDRENHQFTYDDPGAVAAMQFIQNLVAEGCANLVTERNGDQIEFSQGTALFSLASGLEIPFYQRAVTAGSNHGWSIAPVPHTTPDPVQHISASSVSITKTRPETQLAAWLFLKYLTNPEVQAKWAQASSRLPVRAGALTYLGDYIAANPGYATAFELLTFGKSEPPASGYGYVRDMVAESLYAISLGADVVSTLTALNADANAYLEEQLATIPEPPDPWADIDPSGQTVIFWHQQPPARHAALDDLIWKFNSTNKWGITVVAEYQDDLNQKMQSAIGTSDMPDLVEILQSQAAGFQLSGVFSDMTSLVESIKWGLSPQEQADFYPGIYQQDIYPTFGDARLGFPFHRAIDMLYYNQDWLAELYAAGFIDFQGPPTTPEQFKAATCAAAANPFSSSLAEASIGYQLSIDASRFASWTFALGGDIFDYQNAQYSYNNEAAVAAATFLQDLFNEGCATLVVERYGDQVEFAQGGLLFTVGSSAGLPYYGSAVDEGAGFNWSVAALPHTTAELVMNAYGTSVSLPVSSPQTELASWLFLKYYTSPEIQSAWAQASGYLPVRASVAEGLTQTGYFDANPNYATAFDMLHYTTTEPSVPGYNFVRDMVTEAMLAIIEGADVQDTLDQLTEDANISLAEQLGQ